MTQWQDSVAFITGGAQGIGFGIATALVKRGVRVALVDIDHESLDRARESLAEIGTVEAFPLDVRDREAYAEVADRVEASLGPVNLLFNNAGIAPSSQLSELDYAKWDLAVGVNFNGVVNGVQTFLPRMIERGAGGHITNTASGLGLVSGPGVLYTTTKHAVVGLSESLYVDAAPYGIGVSVLCPGPVATNILTNTDSIAGDVELRKKDADGRSEAGLAAGASPESVGEMVVAGIEAGALWIHTDAIVKPYVQQRMEALLASFPETEASAVAE